MRITLTGIFTKTQMFYTFVADQTAFSLSYRVSKFVCFFFRKFNFWIKFKGTNSLYAHASVIQYYSKTIRKKQHIQSLTSKLDLYPELFDLNYWFYWCCTQMCTVYVWYEHFQSQRKKAWVGGVLLLTRISIIDRR